MSSLCFPFPFRRMRFSFLGKWHVTIARNTQQNWGIFGSRVDRFVHKLARDRKEVRHYREFTPITVTSLSLILQGQKGLFTKYDQPVNVFLQVGIYLDSLL